MLVLDPPRKIVIDEEKGSRDGDDIAAIMGKARVNMFALEEFHESNKETVPLPFVVVREVSSAEKTTVVPHCVIYAIDMWEAVTIFNNEHVARIWMSESPKTLNEIQIGTNISPMRGKVETIRIYRMRKDQVLTKELL